MALLEIQGNGESSYVSQEAINNAIQLLEDPLQRVSYKECFNLQREMSYQTKHCVYSNMCLSLNLKFICLSECL